MDENSFDKELLASNLIGAKTLDELSKKELLLVGVKLTEIQNNSIHGKLDYIHLKDIHKFLFEDIYTFAGLDRYESNITALFGKDKTLFTPYDKLQTIAKALFDALKKENYFKDQSKEELIKSLASFMNGLNILHPFREGNGRVQRVFIEYLANYNGYALNFQDISSKEMVIASIHGANGNLISMEDIFKKTLNISAS